MRSFICDRCKEQYQPLSQYPRFTISERSEIDGKFTYIDICPACYKVFCDWLTKGE